MGFNVLFADFFIFFVPLCVIVKLGIIRVIRRFLIYVSTIIFGKVDFFCKSYM